MTMSSAFQITVLYSDPADRPAFDKHYTDVHTPLVATIPGLQRFTVSHPAAGPGGAPPAFYLVAVLEFVDQGAAEKGMGSPQGQATTGDLASFAQAGVAVLQGPADVVA